MSETVFYRGKIKLVSENPEDFAKEYLKGEKTSYSETFLEQLRWNHDEFIVIEDKLYKIYDDIKQDYEPHFCQIYLDSGGELNFITSFYNGGTCLPEC